MKSKITKLYLLVFMSMISFMSNAQPANPDGGEEPPIAPINNYLIILGILGTFLAYSFLNKRLSLKNK